MPQKAGLMAEVLRTIGQDRPRAANGESPVARGTGTTARARMGFSAAGISRAGRVGAMRAVMAVGLAASVGGCLSGDDYFDDGLSAQQENQPVMHRLLTGTVFDPPQKTIAYQARSPLVVPPSTTELAGPQPKGAAVQQTAVAWPKDPDVAAKETAEARIKAGQADAWDELAVRPTRVTPEEVQAARIAGGGIKGTTSDDYRVSDNSAGDRFSDKLTPDQLKQTIDMPSASGKVDISATPTRKYLIEPPEEYRKPATTAEMPVVKADSGLGADNPSNYDPRRSVFDNPTMTGAEQ